MEKKPKTTDVRKSQLSDVKKAYRKERRRIQQQIRRMKNRAYDVPSLLPDIPKRITKASVNRLKKITTEYLYSKSRYIDTETGEILTGEQGRKKERKEAAKRAAQTRKERKRESVTPPAEVDYVDFTNQIFTVFQMEMTQIYGRNERLFNYLTRWFNMARARYGDEDFAEALEQSKADGMWPGWEGVSDTEILVGKLTGILELIGGTAGGREEIIESLEAGEEWEEV